MTGHWTRVFVIAVLVGVLLPTTAVAHETVGTARQRAQQLEQQAEQAREEARRLRRATYRVTRRVDRIAARVGQVERRLANARARVDRVGGRLQEASTVLDTAELRADKAAARADRARQQAERAEADLEASLQELEANEAQRASVVRNAYMYGPGVANPSMAVLHMADGSDPTDVADVLHMLDVLLVDHALLVDDSVRLAEESQVLAVQAQEARDRSEAEVVVAEEAREEAAQRHAEVLVVMDEAEEAVAAEREAATDLRRQRARARRQVERLDQARQHASGRVARRVAQARAAAARVEKLAAEAAAGVDVRPVNGGLARVGGITVAASIAPQVKALLDAARGDGIVLGGHGYRSVDTTLWLRRSNGCPDAWSSPPWACRVPTARPGTSLHEKGLAIDFTWQGSTICYPNPASRCHGNAAYDWLRANAHRYGLHGLSAEAWHFSTTGR